MFLESLLVSWARLAVIFAAILPIALWVLGFYIIFKIVDVWILKGKAR
jgi:hypothetical protein